MPCARPAGPAHHGGAATTRIGRPSVTRLRHVHLGSLPLIVLQARVVLHYYTTTKLWQGECIGYSDCAEERDNKVTVVVARRVDCGPITLV